MDFTVSLTLTERYDTAVYRILEKLETLRLWLVQSERNLAAESWGGGSRAAFQKKFETLQQDMQAAETELATLRVVVRDVALQQGSLLKQQADTISLSLEV